LLQAGALGFFGSGLPDLLRMRVGIDYNHTSFSDFRGRPMPILPCGDPISELL
jgi:hypothetical protein